MFLDDYIPIARLQRFDRSANSNPYLKLNDHIKSLFEITFTLSSYFEISFLYICSRPPGLVHLLFPFSSSFAGLSSLGCQPSVSGLFLLPLNLPYPGYVCMVPKVILYGTARFSELRASPKTFLLLSNEGGGRERE